MARNHLTEYELHSKANKLLHDGVKGITPLSIIGNEILCKEGISDLVGVSCSPEQLAHVKQLASLDGLESASRVLSILKKRAPRTFEYLVSESGYTPETVRNAIKRLKQADLIEEKQMCRYTRKSYLPSDNLVIYSFEVKLSDIKRSLFQAMQHKVFADYSYVIFPFEKQKALMKNKKAFIKFGIGIMLYREVENDLIVFQRAKKSNLVNDWSRFYTLGNLGSSECRNPGLPFDRGYH